MFQKPHDIFFKNLQALSQNRHNTKTYTTQSLLLIRPSLYLGSLVHPPSPI